MWSLVSGFFHFTVIVPWINTISISRLISHSTYIPPCFFPHLSTDGHLGLFYLLAIIHSVMFIVMYHKCSCTSFCMDTRFHFSWVYIWESYYRLLLYLYMDRFEELPVSLKWLLTFLPAVYENSNFSTPPATLLIIWLVHSSHPSEYEVVSHGFKPWIFKPVQNWNLIN